MTIRMIPVDTTAYIDRRFISVEKKPDENGEHKTDREGRLLFKAQLILQDAGRAETVNVTIPAGKDSKEPCTGLEPYSPVAVSGLKAGTFVSKSGDAVFYFSAEAISAVGVKRHE